MNNYCVYIHISPSGKKYVGITSQKPERRWSNGKGYKDNQYFTRAINKYGWNNFEHIIIARGLTEDEAMWLEIELVRVNDSVNKDKGYNICLGGNGTNGMKHSDEWRQEHSKRMSGENNPMFGKNIKDYMTEADYETWKKNKALPSFKGRTHTEESKKKIGDAERGIKNHKATSVICLTTKQIFLTAREAEKVLGVDHSGIAKCCKGKYKSAGKLSDGKKLVWKYVNHKHNRRYRIKKAM